MRQLRPVSQRAIRAEREPAEQGELRPIAREPYAPYAWPEQQPPAYRAIKPGQLRKVARQLRQSCNKPAMLAVGNNLIAHARSSARAAFQPTKQAMNMVKLPAKSNIPIEVRTGST